MALIQTTTFIAAPAERVFDLTRHLAIYRKVFSGRKEQFRSGAASSLLDRDETLSVVASHLGRSRLLMLKITRFRHPETLTEEQVKGDLEHYRHEMYFKPVENGTILINLLDFGPPRDMLGRLLGMKRLRNYLENLLRKRIWLIRHYAETDKWRTLLS